MKKIIILLIIVALALGALLLNLGSASKGLIEDLASDALKTKVTIGKMYVSLVDQSVTISNVKIQNPKGFKAENLLEVRTIDIKAADLMADPILIDHIKVTGVDATYEVNTSGTNVGVIRQNIKDASAARQNSNSSSIHKTIAIKRLEFTNANAKINMPGRKSEIALPPIKLSNIGTETSPVFASRAFAIVANKIAETMTSSAGKAQIKNLIQEKSGKTLLNMDGKLKGLLGRH